MSTCPDSARLYGVIRASSTRENVFRCARRMSAPLLILGVRRSGTTLLRVMLDRNPELAVPDESYFIPQLADRHAGKIDPDAFVDDLRRIPTLLEWGVDAEDVRRRLRAGMPVGDAIGAVYESYAAVHGKRRWGDKTPMYMRHLTLLERLFPEARYVHLIRDGRDAALSFLQMPEDVVTKTWAHPTTVADFACQWRTEVEAAQALGGRVGTGRYAGGALRRPRREPRTASRGNRRVRGALLRPSDAWLRGSSRPHRKAAPAESRPAAHTGAPELAPRPCRGRRQGLRGGGRRASAKPRLRARYYRGSRRRPRERSSRPTAPGPLPTERSATGCGGRLSGAPEAPAARLGSTRVAASSAIGATTDAASV